MTTAIILLLLVGIGLVWAFSAGKKSSDLRHYKTDLWATQRTNEMNEEHDAESQDILAELDRTDNPPGPPSVLHKPKRGG